MHELSFTRAILDIVLTHAEDAAAVTGIHVTLGQLSSMVDDCIQQYWSIIASGTIAEHATLHFTRIPATMRCTTCGSTYSLDDDLPCPHCGSTVCELIRGTECYVESIDIQPACEEESV
jgi:hydrogenase nickel incorporation protein HypA/HybF